MTYKEAAKMLDPLLKRFHVECRECRIRTEGVSPKNDAIEMWKAAGGTVKPINLLIKEDDHEVPGMRCRYKYC